MQLANLVTFELYLGGEMTDATRNLHLCKHMKARLNIFLQYLIVTTNNKITSFLNGDNYNRCM